MSRKADAELVAAEEKLGRWGGQLAGSWGRR
jgi:hypothetical protein